MRAPFDPYGAASPAIDQQLGDAFQVVRFVARHIPEIASVAYHMEGLYKLVSAGGKANADLLGLPAEAVNLGEMEGSIIPDDTTVYAALQTIATYVESLKQQTDNLLSDMGNFTGEIIPDQVNLHAALQALETAIERVFAEAPVLSTEEQAEEGTDNTTVMSPLRTAQAIDVKLFNEVESQKASSAALGVDGTDTNMGTTPGTILSDNGTAKDWFEELEGSSSAKATALGIADDATDMGAGFGKLIPNNPSVSAALHALEDAAIRVGLHVPIAEYPNGSVGALATRVAGGDGRVGNITYGSPDEYITTEAPVRVQQLFTDVQADMELTLPNRVNWIANEAIATVVGENANAMIAGVFSEISTYAVNNREIAGVVGFAKALADRDPSGSGSGGDMWGMWAIAANNGHLAHAIGIEVNVMNQYAHWYDHGDPVAYDPEHYTYGVHIFPDWSTKTNTRALSIRPRNDGAGWATGILNTGYTDVGIFVDSIQAYRDPGDNLLPANPVGLVFGPNTSRKIAVQRYIGGIPQNHWELVREGQFLVWRRSGLFWWMSMDADNNLLNLVNGNAGFKEDGSFRFAGSLSVSSYAVIEASNGGTLALTSAQPAITLDPPGTIASYTVTLPSSPENGQEVSLASTQTITAFTLNGGTVANAPTTFPAASTMRFKFSAAKNAWYRN